MLWCRGDCADWGYRVCCLRVGIRWWRQTCVYYWRDALYLPVLCTVVAAASVADRETLGDRVHAHGPPFTTTTTTGRKSSPGAPDTPWCPVLGVLDFSHLDMYCACDGGLVSGVGSVLPCVLRTCWFVLAAMVSVCPSTVFACSMLAVLFLPRALLIVRRLVTMSICTARLSQ